MKKLLFFIFTALLVAGCSQDSPLEPANEELVIRAYLYAGEPVTDIQITTTLPLGSEETTAPPVNDASVTLVKDGNSYALTASEGDSGYYHYPGDDLTVEPGDLFEIRVSRGSQVATAQTQVPEPPQNVTASSDKLVIPSSRIGFGGFNDSTRSITLTWQEDPSALFYVVVENIEENPEAIASFGGPGGAGFSRRLVFPPTNHNEFRIQRFNISYYGEHIAHVYRVNQEYADLYLSRNQDSRDLNEPLTNINNGLGVFSAFSSQKVRFTVLPE